MNDTHQELRDLITRVVTGDGQQLENLSMPNIEWQSMRIKNLDISVTIEDWIEMLDVARNNLDIYPEEE